MPEDRAFLDRLDKDELRTSLDDSLDEIEWYEGKMKIGDRFEH